LGKQTQKPLGVDQERILIAMKENTAVLILQTKLQTVYIEFPALEIRHHQILYIGIAGTNGISTALSPGKRQLLLTYTIVRSWSPVFS
jgi:hypothetical protein